MKEKTKKTIIVAITFLLAVGSAYAVNTGLVEFMKMVKVMAG